MGKQRQRVLLALGSLAFAALVWSPAFYDLSATGFGDWQMVWHNWEAGRVALARHAELPVWDPYHCGGVSIVGNPESQHLSPVFPLTFVLGTTLALKLFLVLHAAFGFAGMFLLASRHYAMGPAAAVLASVAWGASGFFAWNGSGGHATFLPFFFIPWAILAFRKAVANPRWSAALALVMAVTLFEGGTYPFPYLVLVLGFDALVMARDERQRIPVLRAAGISAVLTALVAAIRILPVYAELGRTPRTLESTDSIALVDVLHMLTDADHPYRWGHEYVWAEYGTYVGWAVVLLAGAGVIFAFRPRQRHLLAGLLIFGALMLGNGGPLYPWPLLHELPVYDSLRVPSRFTVLFSFYLALLAGLALNAAVAWLKRHRLRRGLDWARRLAPALLVLLIGTDIVMSNYTVVNRFDWAPLDSSSPAERFHLVPARNYIREYASFPSQNVGTPTCYNGGMNWNVSRSLWVGDVPQVRVLEGEGAVLNSAQTSSSLRAELRLVTEAKVVFNQNYHPDWITSAGVLEEDEGRLSLRLPAGEHRVQLRHEPATLWPGIWLSSLGLLGCLGVATLGSTAHWTRLWRRIRSLTAARPESLPPP